MQRRSVEIICQFDFVDVFFKTCELPIGDSLQDKKMQRIDFSQPKWDQSTFSGRLKHFFWVTDPRSCVVSSEQLYEAKTLVEKYKYLILHLKIKHFVSFIDE